MRDERSLKISALWLFRFRIDSALNIFPQTITQLVNYKAVYRTAPATPGLLKTAHDGADRQTDTHTDGHGDSMTNSAQRGQVGEHLHSTHFQHFAMAQTSKLNTDIWTYRPQLSSGR